MGDDGASYVAAQAFTRRFASKLLSGSLPADVDALSLNIPSSATPRTPWRLTRLSRRRYYEPQPPDRANGGGRPGYRLIADPRQTEIDSDIWAVAVDGLVSVTALSLDLTSRVRLDALGSHLGVSTSEMESPSGILAFSHSYPQGETVARRENAEG